ncbi:MAG TPA: amidohydrolase family protein [Vicinamibacterales bacterium]
MRALLVAALCGVGVLLAGQPQTRPWVIRNVRVFDGVMVREHQSVVVRAGHVDSIGPAEALAVPEDAEELAGENRTLLPGLIDAYVRVDPLRQVEALRQSVLLGVTTIVTPVIGEPPGPSALVDAPISEQSDVLKIIYDGHGSNLPTLSESGITALVTAAHARRRLAVAHISSERQARGAVAAGVDGLVHLFVGPTVSADFGQLVASRNTFVIPTLSVLYRLCEHSCQGVRDAVRQLALADAVVLAGTDAQSPGTTHDASLHWELELLVEAGLTPTAALRAATSAAADAFQMPDRGRIAAGLRADLVLVNGDPTSRIGATRSIEAVWKRGVRVHRAP